MITQIICNVIMFLNLAVTTGLLIFEFIKFTDRVKSIDISEHINGEERIRHIFNGYGLKMLRVILLLILPVAISVTTCLLDGLTGITGGENEPYIWIPFVVVAIGIIPLTVLFSFRFHSSRIKCNIEFPKRQMSGGEPAFALLISFMYLIILSQAVYTIVLLCKL